MARAVSTVPALAGRSACRPENDKAKAAQMSTTSRDRQVGPYRLERELGRGGMGVVYLATRADLEYRKQVAIKLIHGHRGEGLESRFRAERQILANLEHPNIARLLDGGTTAEGDPYIAMEYVRDGLPVDEWCRRTKVPLRQKLEKFQAICSAVQYAHQHLIVHRDLKPGNILITPEGDVKLLDFGIARSLMPLTRELAAASTPASHSMTPDYASPEQQAGQPAGTGSDIYSLGVVLFEMLTGKRPYAFEFPSNGLLWSAPSAQNISIYQGELLTRDRIPQPIPGDLASVILMTMREDPSRRYGSAGELRRDVERFLEGRAVVAHPGNFLYRAGKFTRRNRLAIAASFLLIAALAGGIVTTKQQAQLAEARAHDAEHQRGAAEEQQRRAEAQSKEADRLRAIAEQQSRFAAQKSAEANRERTRAVEQRDQTMKLATTLAVEMEVAIRPLAGSLPTRRILVSRAIEVIENVYRANPSDPKVLVELGTAYQGLALTQRSRFASSLGDSAGAMKSYRRSLEFGQLAETILLASPNHTVRGMTPAHIDAFYAGVYFGFGDLATINGKQDEALAHYLKATSLAERGGKAQPPSVSRARMPMMAYKKAGDVYRDLGQLDRAEFYFAKAAQTNEAVAKAFPKNPSSAADQLVTAISFGQLLEARSKLPEALIQYEKGASIAEAAIAANGNDSTMKRNLFVALSRAGGIKYKLENGAEARTDFEKALLIAEERFKKEDTNLQAIYDLADAHYHVGQTLEAAGRKSDAKFHLMASEEMAHRADAIDPNAKQTKDNLKRVAEALLKL